MVFKVETSESAAIIVGMNDPSASGYFNSWFPSVITIIALVQTSVLVLASWLVCEWLSKLNRKLHRIESNTRHTAKAVATDEEEAT